MECPHCGFYLLSKTKTCARCKKTIPDDLVDSVKESLDAGVNTSEALDDFFGQNQNVPLDNTDAALYELLSPPTHASNRSAKSIADLPPVFPRELEQPEIRQKSAEASVPEAGLRDELTGSEEFSGSLEAMGSGEISGVAGPSEAALEPISPDLPNHAEGETTHEASENISSNEDYLEPTSPDPIAEDSLGDTRVVNEPDTPVGPALSERQDVSVNQSAMTPGEDSSEITAILPEENFRMESEDSAGELLQRTLREVERAMEAAKQATLDGSMSMSEESISEMDQLRDEEAFPETDSKSGFSGEDDMSPEEIFPDQADSRFGDKESKSESPAARSMLPPEYEPELRGGNQLSEQPGSEFEPSADEKSIIRIEKKSVRNSLLDLMEASGERGRPAPGDESSSSRRLPTGGVRVLTGDSRPRSFNLGLLMRRTGAGIFDFAVWSAIGIALYRGALFLAGPGSLHGSLAQWVLLIILPLAIMAGILAMIYGGLFVSLAGRTPGMMIFGLEMRNDLDKRPELAKAFLRTGLLLGAVMAGGLGLALMVTAGERSRFDKLTGIKVQRA